MRAAGWVILEHGVCGLDGEGAASITDGSRSETEGEVLSLRVVCVPTKPSVEVLRGTDDLLVTCIIWGTGEQGD